MEFGIILKLLVGIALNIWLYYRGFWDFILPKKLKRYRKRNE